MPIGREAALSDFETALLSEPSSHIEKPRIARIILALLVLFFTTLYAPASLTAEVRLDAESVLSVLNQDRARYDLPLLAQNQTLEQAAAAKARDILENDYFAHTSPAGLKPWNFIKNAGFQYTFAGENLAVGYDNALELQNDFMGSPGHRENLLSPLYSEIGIAVVKGQFRGRPATVTVEMFAAP